MLHKKYRATGALLLSIAGFAFFYPYHGTFWGGLLSSGCMAAIIGGLADWFAVSALFKKPLGISYRTEVIERNRERMLREIMEFMCRDLLNPENIMRIVERYDMARMTILYLENAEGKEKIKRLSKQMSHAILKEVDAREIGETLESVIQKELRETRLDAVLFESLRWSLKHGYEENVVRFLLNELIWLVGEKEAHAILSEMIAQIKIQYEGSLKRRQFVSMVLDLSPERLADLAQHELIAYLEKLKRSDHPLRVRFKAWAWRQVDRLEEDQSCRNMIARWQETMIAKKLRVAEKIAAYIEAGLHPENREENIIPTREINAWIDRKIADLKESPRLQRCVDRKLKAYASQFVCAQHGVIAKIIGDRLNEFSNSSLVSFIEARVADDLQMIRINGSLVGAAAGMLLYVITSVAERIWW